MNVEALLGEFRRVMADTAVPPLWSDEEVVTYLNDAEKEACERALLIEDRTTPAVCSVALIAGQADYKLHPSVMQVKRVSYLGRALTETSVEKLDNNDSNWESRTGQPTEYVYSEAAGLRMVPSPKLIGVLNLTVYRLPLVQLSADFDSNEPEIHARHHMRLLPWVYRCAYLKQDAETYNRDKAQLHELTFQASFGVRLSANVVRKHRDKAPNIVKMQW